MYYIIILYYILQGVKKSVHWPKEASKSVQLGGGPEFNGNN